MKKVFTSEQSGRSMIEMLAVLAIIGILSVAGIAGYSKAMGKYKEQKLGDQISTLAANVRTTYATQAGYTGLTEGKAVAYGLVPQDMISSQSGTAPNITATLVNAMGGNTYLKAVPVNGTANAGFSLVINGLNRSACMYIATSDWGAGSAGFAGMTISKTAISAVSGTPGYPAGSGNLPRTLDQAVTDCLCNGNECAVNFIYL